MKSIRHFPRTALSVAAMLGMFIAMPLWAEDIEIEVDYQEARRFFDNKPAKVVYVVPYEGGVRYIDFSLDPLQERIISPDGGGNIQICPEGRRVAYTKDDQVWIGFADGSGQEPFMVTDGINGHWWIHPETGKTYLMVQRGIDLAAGNGIYGVEIDANDAPVGEPFLMIDEPMANAGRSADGRFFANNDEEGTCGRGHGIYEVSPAQGINGLSINHWVYLSAEGWYSGGVEYGGYCNGAMCPAGPGKQFYGAALHMGSGHTSIFIRKPANYADMPLVPLNASKCSYQSEVIHYTAEPDISIKGPKDVGLTRGYANWGYSDWSTHHDYITATGGNSSKSKGNQNGYIMNLARGVGHALFGIRFSNGGVAQPDLWVSSEGVTVGLLSPLQGQSFGKDVTVTLSANAFTDEGTISKVEFFAGDNLLATATQEPYEFDWVSPADGNYNLKARATDSNGKTGESPVVSIEVRGEPILGSVLISPQGAILAGSETQKFSAKAFDQYGYKLEGRPSLTWSVSGGGSIDANGTFTPSDDIGAHTVIATMQHQNRTVIGQAAVYVCAKAYKINFQEGTHAYAQGYLIDDGSAYRPMGPLEYGWNVDNTDHARNRHGSQSVQYRTLNHMQWGDQSYYWEFALPAAQYAVGVCAGDIGYFSDMKITAEDVVLFDSATTLEDLHIEAYRSVEVSDGRLTLSTDSGYGTKICYAIIGELGSEAPSTDAPIQLLSNLANRGLAIGDEVMIVWQTDMSQVTGGIVIELSLDNGRSWHRIQDGESLPNTTTEYSWIIPETVGINQASILTDEAQVRVCEYDGGCSQPSGVFRIDPASNTASDNFASLVQPTSIALSRVAGEVRMQVVAPAGGTLRAMNAQGKTVLHIDHMQAGRHDVALPGAVAHGFLFVELQDRTGRRLLKKCAVR